jgi:hypothetical protein
MANFDASRLKITRARTHVGNLMEAIHNYGANYGDSALNRNYGDGALNFHSRMVRARP